MTPCWVCCPLQCIIINSSREIKKPFPTGRKGEREASQKHCPSTIRPGAFWNILSSHSLNYFSYLSLSLCVWPNPLTHLRLSSGCSYQDLITLNQSQQSFMYLALPSLLTPTFLSLNLLIYPQNPQPWLVKVSALGFSLSIISIPFPFLSIVENESSDRSLVM